MRTTLDVNPELVEKVVAVTGERTKGRAIDRAMEEFIRMRRLEELRALRGKIRIEDNLDELDRLELEEMRKSE